MTGGMALTTIRVPLLFEQWALSLGTTPPLTQRWHTGRMTPGRATAL